MLWPSIRLAHLVSQCDCSLVLLFVQVLASNLLILTHGRQNTDNFVLVNSYKFTRLLHCQDSFQAEVSIYSVHTGLETGYSCTMLSKC